MSVDFSALTPAEQFIFRETTRHDRMVKLVEQMLELRKHLHAAKSQSDRDLYQRQIDAADQRKGQAGIPDRHIAERQSVTSTRTAETGKLVLKWYCEVRCRSCCLGIACSRPG
jgi:hypothetical protein